MSRFVLHFDFHILKRYMLKYLHAYHQENPSRYQALYNVHGLRNVQIASDNESDQHL